MESIASIFETLDDARAAVQRLRTLGVSEDAIALAVRVTECGQPTLEGGPPLLGEGIVAGALSGASLGTLMGLALVGSTVVLPGIGPILVGGPLAAALAGAGLGLGSGGLMGALIAFGISEDEAGWFADHVQAGKIAVFVQSDSVRGKSIREALGLRQDAAAALKGKS